METKICKYCNKPFIPITKRSICCSNVSCKKANRKNYMLIYRANNAFKIKLDSQIWIKKNKDKKQVINSKACKKYQKKHWGKSLERFYLYRIFRTSKIPKEMKIQLALIFLANKLLDNKIDKKIAYYLILKIQAGQTHLAYEIKEE